MMLPKQQALVLLQLLLVVMVVWIKTILPLMLDTKPILVALATMFGMMTTMMGCKMNQQVMV